MNTQDLTKELSKKADESHTLLAKRHPEAVSYLNQKGIRPNGIRDHAIKLFASGAIAASVFLTAPSLSAVTTSPKTHLATLSTHDRESQFAQPLLKTLPDSWKLTLEQEKAIQEHIHTYWGIDAVASLENQRLNNAYGLIGAEQHLPRYPGDTIAGHDEFQSSGITPQTGAWSYFARSRDEMNYEDILREKYYVAVQTLYLPDWNTNTTMLKNWYKHRKVVVVNPNNGKTIVCDIADAGPALRTGKHFGGSPEVMHYLGLDTGMKKGEVVLFFLDESRQPVPLGPVEYNVSIGKP